MGKIKFKLIFLVMVLAVSYIITGCRPGEPKTTETNKQVTLITFKNEIELRLREYESFLRKGDSMALGNMYTIDAEIIPKIIGRENIIKVMGSMIRDGTTGTFETTDIWGNDQLIVEEGKGAWYDKNSQVTDRGKYLLIWKKENGEWKILRDTWFPEKQK